MYLLAVMAGIVAAAVCLITGIATGAYLYHVGQLGQPPLTILRRRDSHKVKVPE